MLAAQACVPEVDRPACESPTEPGCAPAGTPDAPCNEGTPRCLDGSFAQTCNADGNWGVARYCGAGVMCIEGVCAGGGEDAATREDAATD